jgi:hypothetical protein
MQVAAQQLSFGDEARGKIHFDVRALVEAVDVTPGRRGGADIRSRDFGVRQYVDSGVPVARSIGLPAQAVAAAPPAAHAARMVGSAAPEF